MCRMFSCFQRLNFIITPTEFEDNPDHYVNSDFDLYYMVKIVREFDDRF